MNFIVMGVCGSGKSTSGKRLAEKSGLPFIDGDDLHTRGNIRRMARGIPLNDRNRKPWLRRVGRSLARYGRRGGVVIACSALKQSYRDLLLRYSPYSLVYLKIPKEIILKRVQSREGHFMPVELVESQFVSLEEPAEGKNTVFIESEKDFEEWIKTIFL